MTKQSKTLKTNTLWWHSDGSATATIFGGGKPYGHRIVHISPSGETTIRGSESPFYDFDTEDEMMEAFRLGPASK